MTSLALAHNVSDQVDDQHIFLGRQSILNREQNLYAFELLFRSSKQNAAIISNDESATINVINRAFTDLGLENTIGKYKGFINLSAPLLMSDMIELLPKDKIVLEILETVEINPQLIKRCQQLKTTGFSLALDDFTHLDAKFEPLLEIVDVVKLDIQLIPQEELEGLAVRLKKWPVELLAEKVDSQDQVKKCMNMGFNYFQGYYFAKPVVITGKRLNHSELTLVRLLGMLSSERDDINVEQLFKKDPGLTVNLLRLTNSIAIGVPRQVTSVRRALLVLGQKQLRRWLQLLMFSLNSGPKGEFPSPLLQLAACRGKLMELLAKYVDRRNKDLEDVAFLTGITSLMDTLMGMTMDKIIAQLNVVPEVRAAIMDHEGPLGRLFSLVEKLEQNDIDAVEILLLEIPQLTSHELNHCQAEALLWANSIGQQRDVAMKLD
jgi:c-di-GMP-related signal transduction protein